MQTKIYIVEALENSYYLHGICGVFYSKEKAWAEFHRLNAKNLTSDPTDVREYEMNEYTIEDS